MPGRQVAGYQWMEMEEVTGWGQGTNKGRGFFGRSQKEANCRFIQT